MPERRRFGARRVALTGAGVVAIAAAVIVPTYLTVPVANTTDPQVDCLLVLGAPTEIDGSLSDTQRWRVDEAVREYRAGRAQHILFTGGMTSRMYIEAQTMARYARSQGVPASAIVEDDAAMTTRENIRNSARILEAHGWRRVEVISTAEHLPRAALLLRGSGLLWHTHAAPTPGRSTVQKAMAYTEEAAGTALIRGFGPAAIPVLHALALVQHRTGFAVRYVFYKGRGWLRGTQTGPLQD